MKHRMKKDPIFTFPSTSTGSNRQHHRMKQLKRPAGDDFSENKQDDTFIHFYSEQRQRFCRLEHQRMRDIILKYPQLTLCQQGY
jgi:hypothetical protein